MNKVLHVLVYVFLLLAGAGLYIEFQLQAKRTELTDRNKLLEDSIVRVAKTIEKDDATKKEQSVELQKDVAPVEDKINDDPEKKNILDDYNGNFEKKSVVGTDTVNLEGSRDKLRTTYVIDGEGKPVKDGTGFLMKGPGTASSVLEDLEAKAAAQLSRLNSTRDELVKMRERLEEIVPELNKLKGEARQDKATIVERDAKIAELESEKAALEERVTKLTADIEELNNEITGIRRDLQSVREELEIQKEEVSKRDEMIAKLQAQLKKALQLGAKTAPDAGVAVTSLTQGDKGKVVSVDKEYGFVIVRFSEETMKELKGENGQNPLPMLELGIRRDNEYIGRVRIRQEVKGNSVVICDILDAWSQDEAQIGDTIFAD